LVQTEQHLFLAQLDGSRDLHHEARDFFFVSFFLFFCGLFLLATVGHRSQHGGLFIEEGFTALSQ